MSRSLGFVSACLLFLSCSSFVAAFKAEGRTPAHLRRAASCPEGYHSSSGKEPCTACEPGYYQSQTGQTSCTAAQPGWQAPGYGSTAESPCGVGYYSSSSGSAFCSLCPAGSYCNADTTTNPTLCVPGTFSLGGAGQTCTPCPAGQFNDVSGATSCCLCCAGWFNGHPGNTNCQQCPNKGSYQQGYSSPGATSDAFCFALPGAVSSCSQSGSSCPGSSPGSARAFYDRYKKRNELCSKPGYKRCPAHLSGSTSPKYECIDIQNDLESCGGCIEYANGTRAEGRDCTSVAHVDDVRCTRGFCEILSCSRGFTVSADKLSCVPEGIQPYDQYMMEGFKADNFHLRKAHP